jgi:hypothetical protein
MNVSIPGLADMLKKLDSDLYAEPLKRFWERAAESALNQARLRAPVDTGRMRSSLAKGASGGIWAMDPGKVPEWFKVGTNVNRNGFQYPLALEKGHGPKVSEGDRYHYRGGGAGGARNIKDKTKGLFSGASTKGWLTGAFKLAIPDIQLRIKQLAQEIGAKWAAH